MGMAMGRGLRLGLCRGCGSSVGREAGGTGASGVAGCDRAGQGQGPVAHLSQEVGVVVVMKMTLLFAVFSGMVNRGEVWGSRGRA